VSIGVLTPIDGDRNDLTIVPGAIPAAELAPAPAPHATAAMAAATAGIKKFLFFFF
jgi:hypothetical protein